jgi:hypothetical protein
MAQEAGYIGFQFTSITTLERFAKLIAAAEREACAKVCDQRAEEDTFEGGMDLRDYFAAKALQGLLANPKLSNQILKEGGVFGGWIEKSAYGWADAMMKARGK